MSRNSNPEGVWSRIIEQFGGVPLYAEHDSRCVDGAASNTSPRAIRAAVGGVGGFRAMMSVVRSQSFQSRIRKTDLPPHPLLQHLQNFPKANAMCSGLTCTHNFPSYVSPRLNTDIVFPLHRRSWVEKLVHLVAKRFRFALGISTPAILGLSAYIYLRWRKDGLGHLGAADIQLRYHVSTSASSSAPPSHPVNNIDSAMANDDSRGYSLSQECTRTFAREIELAKIKPER
ncbi:hypothetical protein M407DRAFT_24781 [Tulasnella calospora MUT 4182]|uniref:Uncharacterized protein n=1 Tax=Tulasnella calospora MUT 4182 TaxID=1051891 RepID=A0A0C3QHD1_9AGAM|nr:hypothetical protein M407DRAFT_24781 [Tulasnella calospora MUT 4182]